MRGEFKNNFMDLEWITFIGSGIEGFFAVLIPIYMFSIGISLSNVGFVLAFAPFVFVITRLVFSIFSDVEKEVKFNLSLYSFSLMTSSLIYALYPVQLGFILGKVFEGVARGFYWSVSRTAAYRYGRKRDKSSSEVIGYRYFFTGAGRVLGLISYLYIPFQMILYLLAAASLFVSRESNLIKERTRSFSKRIFNKELGYLVKARASKFYYASFINSLKTSIFEVLLNLVLIYLLDVVLSLSMYIIAFYIGIIYIVAGVVGIFLKRFKVSWTILFLYLLSYVITSCIIFFFSDSIFMLFLSMVLFGFSKGVLIRVSESFIAETVDKNKDVSLSIALINLPIGIFSAILYVLTPLLMSLIGLYPFIFFSGLFVFLLLCFGKLMVLSS